MSKNSQAHNKDDGNEIPYSDFDALQGRRRLIDAIVREEEAPLTCAECRGQMVALYHRMQPGALRSEEETEMQAEMATELATLSLAHMSRCDECTAEYALLQETLAEMEAGTLPDVVPCAPFVLSFMNPVIIPPPAHSLAPLPVQRAPLWIEALGGGIVRMAQEVRIWVEASGASFASLQMYLAPPLVAEANFRSDFPGGKSEVLRLPAPEADLSVRLATSPLVSGCATVAVKLLDMAETHPLPDRQLTLRNEQRQLLVGAVSGEDGAALFERLTPGRYFLQIRHQQKIWEIPLEIIEK